MKEGVGRVVKRHVHSILVQEMPFVVGQELEIILSLMEEMMMKEKSMVIEHHKS